MNDQFMAGKAAMMLNGPWQIPALDGGEELNWGVATFPVNKRGPDVGRAAGRRGLDGAGDRRRGQAGQGGRVVKCLNSDEDAMQLGQGAARFPTKLALAEQYATEVPEMAGVRRRGRDRAVPDRQARRQVAGDRQGHLPGDRSWP